MDDNKLTLEEAIDIFSKTRDRIINLEEKALNRLFHGYSELKEKSEELRKEQGIEPTDEDIAKKLGWSLDRVSSLKKAVEENSKGLMSL